MYEPDTVRKRIRLFAKNVTPSTRVDGPRERGYRCHCCGRYLRRWYTDNDDLSSYVYMWDCSLLVVGRWGEQYFGSSVACADCHQKIVEAVKKIADQNNRKHIAQMKAEINRFKRHLGIIKRLSK